MSAVHPMRELANRVAKRLFDVLAAVSGLTVLGPVLLLCMILIRLESKGPAVFHQQRLGRDEAPFVLHKLRTMVVQTVDAPTHETPPTAVTPLGRWLRAWKLDEIPQLWNVVKGEMSIVGPRPCLPSQKELIAARRDLGVMRIRPGITGLAQVKGIDMSDPTRLAATDKAYMSEATFWGDLRLVCATVLGAGRGDRIGIDTTGLR